VELRDVYVGPGAVLTGSARLVQEALDEAHAAAEAESHGKRLRELEEQRRELESQLAAATARLEGLDDTMKGAAAEESRRQVKLTGQKRALAASRKAAGSRPGGR